MKLFFKYIRQRRRGFLLEATFCLIFIFSFFLYHLPLEAVIYPAMICALLGVIFMLFDFQHEKQKHTVLENIRSITASAAEDFPRIEGIADEDYQKIISLISEEHQMWYAEMDRRYADMIEYYIVWVHQIKTPIASMRLHLQNEDTEISRKLSADLLRIEQYVEMVLAFLRLNSESTDYVIRECDLDSIVKQAVKKFAGEFINRKLSLVYEPFHTTVITDEKWLSFVIEQVLSNALKYTAAGSITISLDSDKNLRIRDTGMGIAAEDLPRIFEKGYTGYNGRIDKRASGIGLYLCKQVCNNLGHDIKAESVVDEGTVITIDLSRSKLKAE